MSDLTRWQDNGLTCTKNLPSHTEAYIKTWSALLNADLNSEDWVQWGTRGQNP